MKTKLALLALSLLVTHTVMAQPSNLKISIIAETLSFQTSDVQNISLSKNPDALGVSVSFKPKAAKRISQVTQNNIGKKAQISVGKTIINAPVIQTELGGEFFIATGSLLEAKKVFKALSQQP